MASDPGYKRVYADKAGRLFAGEDAVFGDSRTLTHGDTAMGMDYPSLGYYDFGDDDYDDFGLDLVEDDLGAMDYASLGEWIEDGEDFGAAKPRSYRARGRKSRRRPMSAAPRGRAQVVQKTILSGASGTNPGAGSNTVTIRPQFDFVAEDLTFQGSTPGWTITSIQFGDRIVFSNGTGVPTAVFGTASFVRGLIKGAAIAAGLDISITANLAASTTTSNLLVTLIGLKRGTSGCGPGAV
jgi:hypothetical protein